MNRRFGNVDDPAYIAFTSGPTGEPRVFSVDMGRSLISFHGKKEHLSLAQRIASACSPGLRTILHRDVFMALALGAHSMYLPWSFEVS